MGRRIHVLLRHDENDDNVYAGMKKFVPIEYLYTMQDETRGKRGFVCYEKEEDAKKLILQTQNKYRARSVSSQKMTTYEGPLKLRHFKSVKAKNFAKHTKWCDYDYATTATLKEPETTTKTTKKEEEEIKDVEVE